MLAVLGSRETSGLHKRRRHAYNESYFLSAPQEPSITSLCEVVDQDVNSIPYSISYSKSGNLMSIASEDGCIRILDGTRDLPSSSSLAPSWQAHDNAVFSSHWIKNDRQLLTCSGDSTVSLWDVETRQHLRRLAGHHRQSVKLAAVMPKSDESIIATGSRDGSLALWDIRNPASSPIGSVEGAHAQAMLSKRVTKRLTARSITGLVFLPNTSLVLSSGAGDTTLKVWDVRKIQGQKKETPAFALLCSYSCREKSGPFGITSVALSPDGTKLLANATDSKLYMMSSMHTSKTPLATFTGHHSPPGDHSFYISCGWSSDGSSVAVGSLDNNVYVWNSLRPDLDPLRLECGSAREAFGVSFSPVDPFRMLTISDDSIIRMWHLGLPSLASPPRPLQPPQAEHLTDAEILEPASQLLKTPHETFASSCFLVSSRGGQRSVEDLDFESIPLQTFKDDDKENVDPRGLAPEPRTSLDPKRTPTPLTSLMQPRARQPEITKFFTRS